MTQGKLVDHASSVTVLSIKTPITDLPCG